MSQTYAVYEMIDAATIRYDMLTTIFVLSSTGSGGSRGHHSRR